MKKMVLAYAVAVMLILVNSFAFALDVDFDYNVSKDYKQNLLSTTNLHTMYAVVGYGVEKGLLRISQENKFWQRGVEIIVDSQLAYGLTGLGHEGGHDYYADRNGVGNRSISWSFYNASTSYDLSYNNLAGLEKERISSAGLVWNNRAAEESLVNRIGERAIISEMLWYSANKISMPWYVKKSSAPNRTGSYGTSSNDMENWTRHVAENDFGKMDSLYRDLKTGAVWQGLSLIAPAGASLYYLLTGKTYQIPKAWFSTEAELTDAGVMYALTGLYKHQGITYSVRLGYGKNRVEERTMSQFEAEIRNVPLPLWDLRAKLKVGYTETLGASQSFGIGLEKSFKQFAVGAEANRYGGYHRNNPKATEGSTELLTYVNFKF